MYQIVIVDKFYYMLPIDLKIIIVTQLRSFLNMKAIFFILTKCLNCIPKNNKSFVN